MGVRDYDRNCAHCGGALICWDSGSATVVWCYNCDQIKCPRCEGVVDPKAKAHCGGPVGLYAAL